MKIKILIVEDNSIIALELKNTLERLNYTVTNRVKKEKDIFESIKNDEPNIILMDIELGLKKNGIEIVQDIYKIKQIPVIYLSGVEKQETVDEALDTNPAYYLTKPFNPIQLNSAIKMVIKNFYEEMQHFKNIGLDYCFDVKNKKLFYKNEIQKLASNETQFLDLLVEAKGQVVLFGTIENMIWQNEPVSNDALRVLVSRLRKKIHVDFIESVYAHGFKINC